MSDTLSPLPINADISNATLDYQRKMLAEMGIPLWVSHTTPVQTIDFAHFDRENFVPPNAIQQGLIQETVTSQKIIESPVNVYVTTPENPNNLAVISSDSHDLSIVQNTSESPIADTVNSTVINYSLACMRVNHWILLADNQHLSAHPAEQQLWQTMAQGINAEQTMLNFPIVSINPSQPITHQMRDITSAQMTFIGFIHAELLKAESLQIGALSPLPEMIEDTDLTIINIESIQRLPYLSEMLTYPRQKRQLWELIKK